MAIVELLYDGDCPNVQDARAQLLRAFAMTKIAPRWKEWRQDTNDSPFHLQGFGSPTILVNGNDVTDAQRNTGSSCRLYVQPDGSMRGVPSVETLVLALEGKKADTASMSGKRRWKLNLTMLPGISAALLPKIACPACWPAYAGFLSSIGLGFLVKTAYLLPITAVFLTLAVGALAFRAPKRRGYQPFLLGTAAATIVLIGKFYFQSDPAMYAGLALLITASVWNSWPRKSSAASCSSCVSADQSITKTMR